MTDAGARPVALVTGGARGIGAATCTAFAEAGYSVVVADIDEVAAAKKAAALTADGTNAISLALDVTSTTSVDGAIGDIVTRLGRLDALVNNAGIIDPGPSETISDTAWSRLLAVHLDGTFRCSRAAYQALTQGGGTIVNIASVAAHLGISHRLSYSAAKAGVEGMARALAVEWADAGIRVNAVAPGYTRTELSARARAMGETDMAPLLARIPLHRQAEPSEIAAVVVFLSTPASSCITGQTLMVDGGLTIGAGW